MNPSTKGAIRPKSTLSFTLADEPDTRLLRLAGDLDDLLVLVADAIFDHRHECRLRHIESHLKAAAGRMERVKPYAGQLWNEADAADQGGRSHG